MKVPEIADFLRVSTATGYRLVASGAIPAHRIGGSIRVNRAELLAALAEHPVVVRSEE